MSARDAARAGAWALALSLCACSAKGPQKATALPATEPGGGGDADVSQDAAAKHEETHETARDDLEALDGRVDQAWQELQALDEARVQASATAPSEAAARCERIRSLAHEICTLRDRMCTLAAEHPGQSRYVNACTRAGETCQQARQAADRCPTL